MLSDEERKVMDSLKVISEYAGDNYLAKEHRRKLKLLIELVEKQSKEIEELNYIKRSFDYCVEQENKKWEDKIKAKIEYCREILYSFEKELELKANKDKFIHKESMNCLLGQISILQSLLEKE